METGISPRRPRNLICRAIFSALTLAAVAACTPTGSSPVTERNAARTTPQQVVPRPAYPGYGEAVGAQPIRWTARTIADDFVQLMFFTEWGARTEELRRWEKPVRVGLVGAELAAYRDHAADLVDRFGEVAPRLDISLVTGTDAEITLRTAPRAEMNELAPGALCFFVPFDGDWPAFVEARASGGARWARVSTLEAVTIFIPAFSSPSEIRACFDEEIIQALGPGNDLARLEDSIYNDDNAHGAPTAFDLLMLRLLYDARMASGLNREQTRETALNILTNSPDIRPGADRRSASINDDIFLDVSARTRDAKGRSEQEKWADRAVEAARELPKNDHRLAVALATRSYVAVRDGRRADALRDLEMAENVLRAGLGEDSVRLANVRAGIGIYRLQSGLPRTALRALEQAAPVLAANAKERDLAQTLRWTALALDALGRDAEAAKTAQQALGWARYAYGGSSEVVADWRAKFRKEGVIR